MFSTPNPNPAAPVRFTGSATPPLPLGDAMFPTYSARPDRQLSEGAIGFGVSRKINFFPTFLIGSV